MDLTVPPRGQQSFPVDFLRELRRLIRTQRAATALDLIRQLNSKLRGWANQQRYLVSSRAFRYVDRRIFQALWQWAKRRHPTKGKGWVRAKYYRKGPNQESIFTAPRKNPDGSWGHLDLYRTSSMPIRRHAKVQAEATGYGPAYDDYLRQRREKQRRARAKVFAPARTKPWGLSTQATQQPGRHNRPLKGLSRMRGNSHARTLLRGAGGP